MNDTIDHEWQLLISEQERGQMLQDIAQVALAVGRRLYPERQLEDIDIASGSLLSHKSPVERLGFIAHILPPLTQAIEHIAASPLTAPARRFKRIPPGRARRLETAPLLQAIQGGHAAHWVYETYSSLSVDTPENCMVLAFLHTLRRDAAAIAQIAEASNEAEIVQTAHACASRVQGLTLRLNWEDVSPSDASALPTHQMLAHPIYQRFAEWIKRYRHSFAFEWATPLFTLPSRDTWRLYEAWGLLQTLNALLTLGFEPSGEVGSGQALFAVKQDRLLFCLAKGEASTITLLSPQKRRISLVYNRAFGSVQHSLSRTMYPDITLEGEDGAMWILDPKFKAYAENGAECDDINQMHAYRDAIINSEGDKPVRRAWCLYAGRADAPPRPAIAYGPQAQSVVGALCLRPGNINSFGWLCQLLTAWGIT